MALNLSPSRLLTALRPSHPAPKEVRDGGPNLA
jgi:hypothetical protein